MFLESDIFANVRKEKSAPFNFRDVLNKSLPLKEKAEDCPSEQKITRHRDQVVIRFKKGFGPDGVADDDHLVVRPLNELEFIMLTQKRANDSFWHRIGCI